MVLRYYIFTSILTLINFKFAHIIRDLLSLVNIQFIEVVLVYFGPPHPQVVCLFTPEDGSHLFLHVRVLDTVLDQLTLETHLTLPPLLILFYHILNMLLHEKLESLKKVNRKKINNSNKFKNLAIKSQASMIYELLMSR